MAPRTHPEVFEPGALVVETPCGLGRVTGLEQRNGENYVVVQHRVGGTCRIPESKRSSRLRKALAPHEAEQLLSLLRTQQGDTDPRPWGLRAPELERIRSGGTPQEKALSLHQLYRSPYALNAGEARALRGLEEALLDELSTVMDMRQDRLEAQLHGLHPPFKAGATLRAQPVSPLPSTLQRPRSPVRISGLDFLGGFTVDDTLAVGDPAFLSSGFDSHQETFSKAAADTAAFNFWKRARPGTWLSYVREGWGHTCMLSAVHQEYADRFGALIEEAQPLQTVYVESGQLAIIDAALREDEDFRGALIATQHPQTVKGRGCVSSLQQSVGRYRAQASTHEGLLVLISIDLDLPSTDDEEE